MEMSPKSTQEFELSAPENLSRWGPKNRPHTIKKSGSGSPRVLAAAPMVPQGAPKLPNGPPDPKMDAPGLPNKNHGHLPPRAAKRFSKRGLAKI